MLTDSGLLNVLQQFAFSSTGQPMCIYGGMAYPLRVHLQTPFRHVPLVPPMDAFYEFCQGVCGMVIWQCHKFV